MPQSWSLGYVPPQALPFPDTAQEAMDGAAIVPAGPWGHGHSPRTSIPNPAQGHSSDGHSTYSSAGRFLLPASTRCAGGGTAQDRQRSPGCPVRAGLRQRGTERFRVRHSLSNGTTRATLPLQQSWLTPNQAAAALAGIRSKWAQASWGQAGASQPVCGDTGVCLGRQWLTAASCYSDSSKLHAAAWGTVQLSGLYLFSTDSWLAENVTVQPFSLAAPGLVHTGSSSMFTTC